MKERYLDILDLHKDAAEQRRIAQGQKILDVYQGDHKTYLKKISFDLWVVNCFRKIIDKKIGVLYQTEPTREIKKQAVKAVYEANIEKEMTGIMKEIMLNIELFGSVFVDWKNKEMFTPMQVFEKDGRKMVLKNSTVMEKKFQWVYADTQVYEFVDKKMVRMLLPSELDEYKKEKTDYKKVAELADMQIELTNLGTFLKTATILQSVDQLFTDDVELETLNMSPEIINFMDRESKLEVVHFKADLVNIRLNWLELKTALYNIGGVPEVAVVGDVASRSAKELTAKWYPLVETFRGLAQRYEKIEGIVLSDILLKLYNVNFEAENYTVQFDKDFLPAVKREKEQAEFELVNNIITVKTLLKEENPVLTDAEIDTLLEKNIKTNSQYKPVTLKETNFGEGNKNGVGEG